ncbi:sigma-70 family RNA polymerase sigma factor [Pseudoprimorskyibacter insulae]|uniref:RNA polymerase sigma factor FliA n=1 Tax=Pseudoprimorskyibacter insulae TaxID=1695997 RepID=A0A2R8AVJ9_9RHOB|nr:FliA/WhiG family RNA polymerase sigma factor [Pseudoprimorskyibacter insulae]SPF80055.1 RNA polymerase sigma factor FliA [Pseudoprimorskyibacter insulae]
MMIPRSYEQQALKPEKLVEEHMHLVQRIAWHFQGRVGKFAEIEDLLQAGYLGLVDASQRYNVRDGVSFASYASIRIRGSIVDLLRRNSNLCRATITMRQKAAKVQRTLEHKLGRRPETEEIAAELEMTVPELKEWEARFQVNQLQSLDEVYSDHSILFSDRTPTQEDLLEQNDMKRLLREALEELPEREALVLQLYYVEEMNVYEIAAVLEVTTGRVSQIKKAAIFRLRDLIEKKSA